MHVIYEELGHASKELLFFHAFTKGDQVSVFVDPKKKTIWTARNNFVDLIQCFKILSSFLAKEEIKKVIIKFESFVCLMHDKTINCLVVNSGRRELFVKKSIRLLFTLETYINHTMWASYLTNVTWAKALVSQQ